MALVPNDRQNTSRNGVKLKSVAPSSWESNAKFLPSILFARSSTPSAIASSSFEMPGRAFLICRNRLSINSHLSKSRFADILSEFNKNIASHSIADPYQRIIGGSYQLLRWLKCRLAGPAKLFNTNLEEVLPIRMFDVRVCDFLLVLKDFRIHPAERRSVCP